MLLGTSGQTIDLKIFYVSSNCSLNVLTILCQGLVDVDGNQVYNPKLLPWSAAEKVNNIKPNTAKPKEEVI